MVNSWQFVFKNIKYLIHVGGIHQPGVAAHQALLLGEAELLKEGVVVAVDIEEYHGLGLVGAVQNPFTVDYLQLVHDHDFGDFVDGADAAGEGNEGIAGFHDALFALGHAADTDELGDALRVDDVVAEKVGDDADDAASLLQRGAADHAHEAEVASAIDEGVSLPSDAATEGGGGLDDFLVARQRRAAEDCYVHFITNQVIFRSE